MQNKENLQQWGKRARSTNLNSFGETKQEIESKKDLPKIFCCCFAFYFVVEGAKQRTGGGGRSWDWRQGNWNPLINFEILETSQAGKASKIIENLLTSSFRLRDMAKSQKILLLARAREREKNFHNLFEMEKNKSLCGEDKEKRAKVLRGEGEDVNDKKFFHPSGWKTNLLLDFLR